MNDRIDVGVLGKNGKNGEDRILAALETKELQPGKLQFQFGVNEEPGKARIDPFNKMIDLNLTTTRFDGADYSSTRGTQQDHPPRV